MKKIKNILSFFRNTGAPSISLTLLFIILTLSISANLIAPYGYDEGEIELQNLPPVWFSFLMSDKYKEELAVWAGRNLDRKNEYGSGIERIDAETGEIILKDIWTGKPVPDNIFEKGISHLDPGGVTAYFSLPLTSHLMGTDEIGQDIFSRLLYGTRLSIFLAFAVTVLSITAGVLYGAVSGYAGGTVDNIMMRFVDFMFGIPFIFLVILLTVFFGRELYLIFIGLGIVYWILPARIARGLVLSLKEKDFIAAAKAAGSGNMKIIFRHIIPNISGSIAVYSALLFPQIMLLEAFLSFIGLGISPPEVSLGVLISDGASVISSYSWPVIFPGIIFSALIFSLNYAGDWIRDLFDPSSGESM